jgi:MYXO-CTERM domain-containing protein
MHRQREIVIASVFGAATMVAHSAGANPNLTKGTWVEITPPGVVTGAPETCIGQGVAIDYKHPATVYWGTTPYTSSAGGLFKTTDGGSTWKRIGKVTPIYQGATDQLDEPLHVRIDPNDSNHLYVGDGVRGSSEGFWISTDGGETFTLPMGFTDALKTAGIDNQDIYDVAPDPTDFKHVLISFHYRWGWTDTKWNTNSGVMESKDGGMTWIVHEPVMGWGSGHAVKFLYNPALCLGNSNTWLLATQGDGFWKTTDGGATWKQVSKTNITHGGGTIYYTAAGVLYASGAEQSMRSTDNGDTWTSVGPNGTWCVYGDGTTLYTGKSFGANQPYSVSPEKDGMTWSAFNAQKFPDGPYEMAYDWMNGILYSSNWSSGVWALKVGDGSATAPMIGDGKTCPTGTSGDGGAPPASDGGKPGTGGASGTGGGNGAGGSNNGTGGAAVVGTGSGGTSAATTTSGSGGDANPSGGTGGTSSATENGTPAASNDAGCACRTTSIPRTNALPSLLIAALALLRRNRRRQDSSRSVN